MVAGCLLVAGFAAFFAFRGGGFYRSATGPEGLEGYDYESRTYPTNDQRIRAIAFIFKLASNCHSEERSDEESRCMRLNC